MFNAKRRLLVDCQVARDKNKMAPGGTIVNHWGHTPRGASPRQPSDASSGNHPVQVPMQVPFPCQLALSRKH